LAIAIQLANQAITVPGCLLSQSRNKGFDQIPTSITQDLRSTEISGITLNSDGIEFVLSDQKAELVPKPRVAIARTV
jgi:hypothetical protein